MILARNIIALARINDVTGTTYYYKSQVSTAAKPAKPTAATPSGWSTTEPAYNAANSVYVTVKTTYSDNSFSYSDVSLASAYEGAKEAHNTAASAKSTAEAAMEQSVEYITGTQTGATGSWTGVTSDTALAVGKTIAYKLPFAGSGNASLTLTLAGGSKTAAIPVYLNTTRVTTHFGAGAVINMTYDGSAWRASSIPNSNETNHILNNFCGKTGVLGIWRYALFMRDGAGTYQNICTAADGTITSTTAATKKPNPNGFEPGSALYYSSGSGYNANANISSSVYASYGAFDSRYSFNTTLTAGSLTTYKNVYLVGTISQEDGLFYLDEVWWTQTPDTKGKIYILVGSCYDSTTSNCRISLYEQNTWYIHDGTGLTPYNDALSQKAQDTANGAQEAVDQAAESIAELSDNLDEQISGIQSSISDLEDGLERQAESVANQIAEVDRANDEIRSSINSVDATYANAFSQLYQYIRFITDQNGAFQGVELGPLNGEDEERLQLRVGTFRDDKNQLINCISFSKGDENLGYWDGQNLYTGNIIVKVTQRAQFGNFAWVPRATGSLSFMKVV